jgi:hypothetical protein
MESRPADAGELTTSGLPGMKVLTVRQPWAELIVSGRKDVENRTRRTNHRGLLAIHAGLGFDDHEPPVRRVLDFGAIIGVVDVVDCTQGSRSRWALPLQWHWLLANARRLSKPIPYRGALGLWTVDPATERLIRRRLRG